MRNHFDHAGTQIGIAALAASGVTTSHDRIVAEAQYADLRHEPDPARHAERAQLGLLGRLASVVCLFELYSGAPSAEDLRSCLAKHLALWRKRVRETRSVDHARRRHEPPIEPSLWIIAAESPAQLLASLELECSPDWPFGVYLLGGDILRTGIVVASQLPPTRDTLLVRLMAGGQLLPDTTKEVDLLPVGAPERIAAENVLLWLLHELESRAIKSPKEQEYMGKYGLTFTEGRLLAAKEAGIQTQLESLLTVLRLRRIDVPRATREQIERETELELLKRWFERAILASSIEEVMAPPPPISALSAP